jgi:hypothetical protein
VWRCDVLRGEVSPPRGTARFLADERHGDVWIVWPDEPDGSCSWDSGVHLRSSTAMSSAVREEAASKGPLEVPSTRQVDYAAKPSVDRSSSSAHRARSARATTVCEST